MAVWALRQLVDDDVWASLHRRYTPHEADEAVLTEWQDGQLG
jgi:hypothetical protein